VHPVLADRRRFLAYAASSLPFAAVVAGVLTRPPDPIPPSLAAAIAAPQAVVLLALLLPAWYLCRTLPVGESTLPRLAATHGAAALATSLVWVYAGVQAARLLGAALAVADLPRLYGAHAGALLAAGTVLYVLSA